MFFSNVIIYSSNSSSLLFRWLLLKWLLQTFIFYKTPLGETRCLSIYLFIYFFFFECLGIQFFSSLTCYLRDTMPCQRSPTLLPREAEDFPRGGNHSKHMPLLTCLASLQPICYKS